MARDILGEYGPESSQPQSGVSNNGGRLDTKDVRNYQPPVGPSSINDPKTPGIHGSNHGNNGTQGRH